MSTPFHDIATQLADLCVAKNAAYGDSVGKAAEILAIIYPDGLRPDQYLDALFVAKTNEKSLRIAQGADAHGEDPRLDRAGYDLLALVLAQKENASCNSARPADRNLMTPENASAPNDAKTQIPANDANDNAQSSTQPSSCASPNSSARVGAFAKIATGRVYASVGDLAKSEVEV